MGIIHYQTVLFLYAISNGLITFIMFWFWRENHQRFRGLTTWLTACILLTAGLALSVPREGPDRWITLPAAQSLMALAMTLFVTGLLRFTGLSLRKWPDYALFALFFAAIVAAGFFRPALLVRQVCLSVMTVAVSARCAWILLAKAEPERASFYRPSGYVFTLLSALFAGRILYMLIAPLSGGYVPGGIYQSLFTMASMMLGLALAFSLVFMINGRLFEEIQQLAAGQERLVEEVRIFAGCDTLTGIYNRLKMEELLTRELSRAARYGRDLSIIIVDIDRFKRVNDNFGHQAGDRVLQGIAWTMASEIRASDFLGRWGGEEFLIICPETARGGARRLAEKIRRAVAAKPLPSVGHETASFGVGEFAPGDSEDDLLQKADSALYKAKRAGRNRVA